MHTKNRVVSVVFLLSMVLILACGGGTPSAPSPAASPVQAPAPPPVSDLSQLLGVWNVTVRLTEVSGSGCVAETMHSQIGVPVSYSLSITPKGSSNVAVTLASTSGDYACTFTPLADSSGFTTFGQGGYFTCKDHVRNFYCGDGTLHALFSWGQDISGRLSGAEIGGVWEGVWDDMGSGFGVQMKAEFTGSK